ncbi:MAG: hypothetical protein M1834_001798 [Cirrosporium novae-zelandiae]|nr:MAG: hypothetical protein M1834_001798 [Cirrosporium novae-zelandiae]
MRLKVRMNLPMQISTLNIQAQPSRDQKESLVQSAGRGNCVVMVRRKSGPKRGYVKQLEARLAQVETLLKSQEPSTSEHSTSSQSFPEPTSQGAPFNALHDLSMAGLGPSDPVPGLGAPFNTTEQQPLMPDSLGIGSSNDEFSWEMIGLGLDEPLPAQEVVDELHQIYFEKIHPSVPMIHRPRYFAALNLAPHMRPPICLRYIMWSLAASVTDKYFSLQEHFYHRARKYIQQDEMKGHGESTITVAHSQCWTLIATYEFKMMYFPRAWVSTGRSVRLAQMMGMHRLDGVGLDVKQCLPAPRDWTEREERRRTFWMAYCEDRYASIGTGWPMTIDEKDIMTNLPASEEAFEKSKPQRTVTLQEVLTPEGASKISAFAGVVVVACLFGRNLTHLHRPDANDNDEDLNGEFWKRHRQLDNVLLNIQLSLPSHLRIPEGISDPNIVFLNMSIHTSTICLHQAAIFKADKNHLPAQIGTQSKERCLLAADRIANMMRLVSGFDLTQVCMAPPRQENIDVLMRFTEQMNPFLAFCLYVAARVFVQYLKSNRGDLNVRATLQFLLSAMRAMTRQSPIAESFLIQLDVDLEGSGLESSQTPSKPSFGMKPGAVCPKPHTGPAILPPSDACQRAAPSTECPGILRYSGHQPQTQTQIPADSRTSSNAQNSNGSSPLDFNNLPQQQFSNATLVNRSRPVDFNLRARSGNIPLATMSGVIASEGNPKTLGFAREDPPLDMDISVDNESERHHSTSTDHSTPASCSNKASSHTSPTPPQSEDSLPQINRQYMQQQRSNVSNSISQPSMSAFYSNSASYGFDQNSAHAQFFSQQGQETTNAGSGTGTTPGRESDNNLPPGWDFEGFSPGISTGMTPSFNPGDPSSWSTMLENMAWIDSAEVMKHGDMNQHH